MMFEYIKPQDIVCFTHVIHLKVGGQPSFRSGNHFYVTFGQ